MNTLLQEISPELHIEPVSEAHVRAAQAHLDNLTKPQGSLGRLEELACRLFAMRQGRTPLAVAPAMMFTVAGDHGVAAQGVSAYPQAVTRQMVQNFLDGGAAINALCRTAGMELRVVDAGCVGGPYAPHPLLLDRRIADGTADMTRGPAMSRGQCLEALRHGRSLADEAVGLGNVCLGAGEMGIANTTAATALYCAYLGLDAALVAGPGTGASADMVRHKAGVVRQALAVNRSRMRDAIDTLACVGGFEIAVMAGIMLGAAEKRVPVLVDGFISTAAFVAARAICPHAGDYAILTHASAEPGYAVAMRKLGERPLLDLGLRLGEGTGAALAYNLLQQACAVFNDMATFASAGVAGKES